MPASTARRPGRTAPGRRPPAGRAPTRRTARRRRRGAVLAVVAALVAGGGAALWFGPGEDALREITLPLRHEDIIRQQARDKHLDPALIAAVIYQESKFRDQTSHAGARGLMQVTPATARFIAHRSGGTSFTEEDLATPQVNIAYGSYYLRYLLDRYDGRRTVAVAAYNAGETNVDRWLRRAGGPAGFDAADIPFPETRHYVEGVLDHREDYRDHYADELGLR
ncbi:MAG TPA: lytic transglycosylase domain-containing protein [Thermoleophilaceae bacterium]|jgi:soluble lytic murein transglycosylase